MARDHLPVLARLRQLQTERARRAWAERLAQLEASEAALAGAKAALLSERGASPRDHAAWLPRGLAERERAERGLALAADAAEAARHQLVEARTAEAAIERLRELRQVARSRLMAARAQGLADAAAQRRHIAPAEG
jgi:hypothetical protein